MTYRQNNALAEQDISVFDVLDEDQSGLIERDEMRLSAARIAERDSDFDQCITFDEFLDETPDQDVGVVVNSGSSAPPGSVHAEMLRNAAEPLLPGRLMRKYDDDLDERLTSEELGWSPQRIELLDSNEDGGSR